MLEYLWDEWRESQRGMALHYPLLYAIVRGMEAREVFEFGAGVSTRVILDALEETGGSLRSCSTEAADQICGGLLYPSSRWTHFQMVSEKVWTQMPSDIIFDVVLHDGSHAAPVVEDDLRHILPRMAQFGMLLVHDTQHSYSGKEVRRGLLNALQEVEYSMTTLPYGFGLTLVRIEGSDRNGRIHPRWRKQGSPHETLPVRVGG